MCLLTARRSIRLLLSSLLFGLLVPLLAASPVAAATFTVTSTADSGAGSLRAAIASANAAPGSTIHIATAGTYTLTTATPLTITAGMTIDNTSGGTVIIDGGCATDASGNCTGGGTTVFGVNPSSAVSISISGVTIQHGNGSLRRGGGEAGGILLDSGNLTLTNVVVTRNRMAATSSDEVAGGILSIGGTGTVTLVNSVVSANTATAPDGSTMAGGIVSEGDLTLTSSLVSGNSVKQTGGTASSDVAGGIVQSPGPAAGKTLTMTNVTVSGNTVSLPIAAAASAAGGVAVDSGTDILSYVTIASNSLSMPPGGIVGAGGLDDDSATVTLASTIVATNTGGLSPDVHYLAAGGGGFASGGYNLIGVADGSGVAWGVTDKTGTAAAPRDPKLAPLADNGGPTLTRALYTGSPAIDAIPPAANGCGRTVTVDQRGVARPVGAGCDIGAFEGSVAPPPGGGGGGNPNCATLAASPNPVPFGTGIATLAWDTCDGSRAQLTVSNNGGPEENFVASGPPTGSAATKDPQTGQGWLVSGTYIFRLYRADSHTLLAGLFVTKLNPKGTTGPAIVASPSSFAFQAGVVLNTTTVQFDTGDNSVGDVYVALNGGTPVLFTENVASPGAAGAPNVSTPAAGLETKDPGTGRGWIQSGTYTFTLKSKATGVTLGYAIVTTQAGLAAAPNPVGGGSAPLGTSTQLTFNTGDGTPGAVCVANALGASVPNTYSNSGAGVSTLTGLTTGSYTATLYVSASGQPITAVLPGVGGAPCTANVPLTPAPGVSPVTITVTP